MGQPVRGFITGKAKAKAGAPGCPRFLRLFSPVSPDPHALKMRGSVGDNKSYPHVPQPVEDSANSRHKDNRCEVLRIEQKDPSRPKDPQEGPLQSRCIPTKLIAHTRQRPDKYETDWNYCSDGKNPRQQFTVPVPQSDSRFFFWRVHIGYHGCGTIKGTASCPQAHEGNP